MNGQGRGGGEAATTGYAVCSICSGSVCVSVCGGGEGSCVVHTAQSMMELCTAATGSKVG